MNNNMKTYPRVLAIAGSDSGGGAGIQADIKAVSATGGYAASAITAVTVQNTLGVQMVHPVPVDVVAAQIDCVLSDIGADAIKIGMMHSAELIEVIAEELKKYRGTLNRNMNVVLDPVMVSTSGHKLMEDSAVDNLKKMLVPLARVITPNVPEAEVLSGDEIRTDGDLRRIARKLSLGGRVSVLMKAGHLDGDNSTDVFYNAEDDRYVELPSVRFDTVNTHGTGCTLSSAIASYLAQGRGLDESLVLAKEYITKAIRFGKDYRIGHGHGPVKHFF